MDDCKDQFNKCKEEFWCKEEDNNIPYDCLSIMHYREDTCSKRGAVTMRAKDPSSCDLRSGANVLTSSDIMLLNVRIFKKVQNEILQILLCHRMPTNAMTMN